MARAPNSGVVTDPGQFCERCGAFEHQIGKGPPGEVRAGDSVADITARLPSPVAGSRLTPAVQSRGTLKPAPAVGDRDSRVCGKALLSTSVRYDTVPWPTTPSRSVLDANRYGTARPPMAMRPSAVRCA